jgi:hypothetical protein
MNNEIILQHINQQKPKCYEYFQLHIIPKLEMQVKPKLYEFENEILDSSKLLDELFFDVIKILWQKSEIQKQYISIVFLLLCDEDNFREEEQRGGIGSIYSIIFALIFIVNITNANIHHNRMYKGEPPSRPPQFTLSNPVVITPNEMQNPFLLHDFSLKPTELYREEMFLTQFQKIIDLLFITNYAKPGLSYIQSKTGKSVGIKLLKRINSLINVTDTKQHIHIRLINALKFFGFDINRLIMDSGITISLGLADTIGFSQLLSEIISVGLLPEVKFAIIAAPILLESLIGTTISLEPTVAFDIEAQRRIMDLYSEGGKRRKTRKQSKKYKRKQTKNIPIKQKRKQKL